MRVTSASGPMPAPADTGMSASQQAARARAIAIVSGQTPPPSAAAAPEPQATQQQQATPPVNPNSVSPEEMGAIAPSNSPLNPEVPEFNGQKGTSETPNVATKSPEEPLSPQYVQFARREKALRAETQRVRAEADALKAEKQALAEEKAKMQSALEFEQRFAKDPWTVLQEKGVTYDQLTQRALNAPSPEQQMYLDKIAELEGKLAKVVEQQETFTKNSQESQTKAYQQAVAQIGVDVTRLVDSDPNAYEMIRETRSQKAVVDLIEKTFNADGVLLTTEEAAQQVEDYLTDEALKVNRISKIQKRLGLNTQAAPKSPTTQQQPQREIKTLSNKIGTAGRLSARDRAILAFEGKLQKQ